MPSYELSQSPIYLCIRLMRPKHWVKNLFVFAAPFFAAQIGDVEVLTRTVLAFVLFCLTASAVYVLNDLVDRKQDAKHPYKKNRPLASGKVKPNTAVVLLILLLGIVVGAGLFLPPALLIGLGLYFVLNVAYSFYLKQLPMVDVAVIAVGFLIRIWEGGLVNDIPISSWLVLQTFLLSLFMGFAKRIDDVSLLKEQQVAVRKSALTYDIHFLNIAMAVVSSSMVVCYILYTVSPEVIARTGSEYVYLTSFFVVLGVLQYLHRIMGLKKTGDPIRVLYEDHTMHVLILGWVASLVFILYFL